MKYSWQKAAEQKRRAMEKFGSWKESDCPEMLGDNKDHRCVKCGNGLTGRQLRWCSQDCVNWFLNNHQFGTARRAAVQAAIDCVLCGEPLNRWFDEIEVDHIEPAQGRHGLKSCIHHQSNLRALHKGCHKARTREQRTAVLNEA